VLTGKVLINGKLPAGLTSQIKNNCVYKRSFGERDFEVSDSSGVQKTLYPFGGCFYEFGVEEDTQRILIHEIQDTKLKDFAYLELLDFSGGIESITK
jgi:hypothetical protein